MILSLLFIEKRHLEVEEAAKTGVKHLGSECAFTTPLLKSFATEYAVSRPL